MYDYYRKCLKCGSKKLTEGFGINKSGEAYKTCINCRTKDRINRERYSAYREKYSYIDEHVNNIHKVNNNNN